MSSSWDCTLALAIGRRLSAGSRLRPQNSWALARSLRILGSCRRLGARRGLWPGCDDGWPASHLQRSLTARIHLFFHLKFHPSGSMLATIMSVASPDSTRVAHHGLRLVRLMGVIRSILVGTPCWGAGNHRDRECYRRGHDRDRQSTNLSARHRRAGGQADLHPWEREIVLRMGGHGGSP